MHEFTLDLATAYAGVALANVCTEYPHHLQHLLNGDEDVGTPRQLHPAFYGSYDWHSSVHMHWLLMRCLRQHRRLPLAQAVIDVLDRHLTPAHLERETAYCVAPGRVSFERPYGWAWILKLAHEANGMAQSEPVARAWSDALAPMARVLASRWRTWISQSTYPMRAGSHANSAFSLIFAYEWAMQVGDGPFAQTIRERAEQWFGQDKDYPARYEPSGDDFLSGGLCEAVLMHRLLGALGFSVWWSEFCPKGSDMAFWLSPAHVSDRADPKTAHLDGLNLSRAWCMKRLHAAMPPQHALGFERAMPVYLEAALPQAVGGHYVGSHWLATFAALALTD